MNNFNGEFKEFKGEAKKYNYSLDESVTEYDCSRLKSNQKFNPLPFVNESKKGQSKK